MELVLWILGGYVVYYLCLFIWDAIKNGVGEPDEEESQMIEVDDMVVGERFKPKQMELSQEVRDKYLQADDTKKSKQESSEKPSRVCGAMFAQGYEVESYDKEFVRASTARFDTTIRSV